MAVTKYDWHFDIGIYSNIEIQKKVQDLNNADWEIISVDVVNGTEYLSGQNVAKVLIKARKEQ